jgi:hypothetical protein
VDTETAIQTQIEPRLVGALGRSVANALLTQATLCYVTTMGTESKRYEAFVHSLFSDERLIEVWGLEGARERGNTWLELLGSLSEVEESKL